MKHFISLEKLVALEAMKGAFLSSVQTENLTVAYTNMKAGVEIPLHRHPQEAIDILLEGVLEMQIGEKLQTVRPGMITTVPANVPHRAKAVTNCKVVTVLHPKRNMQ